MSEPTYRLPVPVKRVLRQESDQLALERTWRRIAARPATFASGRTARMRRIAVAAALTGLSSTSVFASVWASEFDLDLSPAAAIKKLRLVWQRQEAPRPHADDLVGRLPSDPPSTPSEPQGGAAPPSVDPANSEAPTVLVPGLPEPDGVSEAAERAAPARVARIAPAAIPTQTPASVPSPAEKNAETAAPDPLPLSEDWRTVAARGDHAEAFHQLGPEGFRREIEASSSTEDLFFLADLARLADQAEASLLPLQKIVRDYPHHPGAALAAFTAGKIRVELGYAAQAAGDFQTALVLGLPKSLEREAMRRRAEAEQLTKPKEQP